VTTHRSVFLTFFFIFKDMTNNFSGGSNASLCMYVCTYVRTQTSQPLPSCANLGPILKIFSHKKICVFC
jgi:hypothetical protein